MFTTIIIISLLAIIFSVFGLWLMRRTYNVLYFREDINIKCKDWSTLHMDDDDYESAYNWCYNTLPDFKKMVYSFKPLKLKYWLTEDIINKLNT